jgi:hypothetical protein
VNDEVYLYIDFYRDGNQEFAPAQWAGLASVLGCEPAVSIVADVTGRHPGDDQVRSFAALILGRFKGFAQDDFSDHFWTAQEVLSGHRECGLAFFDYRGTRLAE